MHFSIELTMLEIKLKMCAAFNKNKKPKISQVLIFKYLEIVHVNVQKSSINYKRKGFLGIHCLPV